MLWRKERPHDDHHVSACGKQSSILLLKWPKNWTFKASVQPICDTKSGPIWCLVRAGKMANCIGPAHQIFDRFAILELSAKETTVVNAVLSSTRHH